MAWGPLGTQFCLELAFGVLLGLCLIPKAPMGPFFYRMMGTTLLIPLLMAGLMPPLFAEGSWAAPITLSALAAALAFPVIQGPVRQRTRFRALLWGTACTGLALVFAVRDAPAVEGPTALALGSLSAMATGTVAGGVGLAMVVGHSYLTIPKLPIATLVRLNRFTVLAMLASAVLLLVSCLMHGPALRDSDLPLTSPMRVFFLSARVSVGLAMPLLFAWMASSSLAYKNTRSATGILYASTVLVLIGAWVSISLQDRYGVPL